MSARNPHWHGILCADTVDEITERLRELLDGRYFTLVMGNSYDENSNRFSSIEVYPSQRLTSEVSANHGTYLGVHWSTRLYSMGVTTQAKTQAEGRAARPHGYVSVSFERDRVRIDHYAPAGYRLQWVMAVEHHDEEEGA